jgi:hypothetical protein
MARAKKSAAPAKIAFFSNGTEVVVALEKLGYGDMVAIDCYCVIEEAMVLGCNCENCKLLRSRFECIAVKQ